MMHDDEITSTSDLPSTEYRMPVYEAIKADPMKGARPILTALVIAFFGLRWLMKS